MSQSHNQKDSQGMLQSMLQRLKLQPGKEGQAYLQTPVPTTAASTWGQDGKRGAFNLQKVNSSIGNSFEFGTNGISSKEFGISAASSNFGEIQQPGHGCEVDSQLISFPSQKDNIDGETGEERAAQPVITPTETGQLFPVESLKDADIASFKRTDGARVSFDNSAMTRPSNKDSVPSMGQNHDQDQSFTPKVYVWSSKPTDANVKGQENELLHTGNGGFGALAQSKDLQIVPVNSSSRRKSGSSENKTRRWTQKIKERWNRPGSFGRKEKEEGGRVDQKSEQGTDISPQNQLLTTENLINTSNMEEERTLPSLDSRDPSATPPTHTEDGTNEGYMRSTRDFEFGLGSFSLLEEIVTGQEWANFLNPNQSAASANQRPSELKIPPNPRDGHSSLILNQQGGVDNRWSFRGTETSPDLDFSMTQISPDAFQAVGMDVSEGTPAAVRDVLSAADQLEPMEHGQTRRPPFVQYADIMVNSALKSRVQLNRKRQHQSADRRDERLQADKISDGKEAGREGSLTSNHVMEETGESQNDNFMPLNILKSPPPPLSPFTPFAPAFRGVLKHSISQDSQFSIETQTKRRRVEENQRVRFSDEVVIIEPPELHPDATDSEEDSGSEEDSVIEQECDEEQAAIEEVAAPARRHALPAWILALKRRNTGRRHR
ncbi:uncharacterized protein LOC115014334 [Cottoperca gobio]|uniref:Uncharacterized protein LOC115014334 n=1 Tax=Cottoperca gobio TaxID=56716 RepID=A0A6J2QEV3_COTGO|nr:uncharacterized protein LOC115014334 [Cottoperca gobio]